MNLHEYQAKDVFRSFGIPVPAGQVAGTPEEAVAVAQSLGGPIWVVKAQVHAGGRGKNGLFRCPDDVAPPPGKHCDTVAGATTHGEGVLPAVSAPIPAAALR